MTVTIRRRRTKSGPRLMGRFEFVARDKDGVLLKRWASRNLVVNAGLNYLRDIGLLGGAQDSTWFVGLMAGSPTVAAADTIASHAGWTEAVAGTDYQEANRQAWTGVAGATGVATNSAAPAIFTVPAAGGETYGGAFICSVNSGTTGTLLCGSAFSGGDVALPASATIEVTYVLTFQDA